MSIPEFLQEKLNQKQGKSDKGDFREKCLLLLQQIRGLNEEKYHELMNIFRSRYDKMNIQRKKLLGFYAQLKSELMKLQDDALGEIRKTTKRVATGLVQTPAGQMAKEAIVKAKSEISKKKKEVKSATQKAVKAAGKKLGQVKKKVSKKAAPPASAKKSPAKKTGKKKSSVKKKK